ncbi:hypothetical protein [Roseibium sp.]|uniref:hypothetical protein n=1 Tax=Roseibium sp. TaxID=1936156 RepID=UPI003B52149D
MFEQYRNHAGQYAANYYRSMLAHQKSLDQYGNYFVASKIGEAAFWTAAMSLVGMCLAPRILTSIASWRAGAGASAAQVEAYQASHIYQGLSRWGAGLSVGIIDEIRQKGMDGKFSSGWDLFYKFVLITVVSMAAVPGDKVSTGTAGRLDKWKLKYPRWSNLCEKIKDKFPKLPGVYRAKDAKDLSFQTIFLGTALASKSVKPMTDKAVLDEILKEVDLERHVFDRMFDEHASKFAFQLFEMAVAADRAIQKEYSTRDFAENVPRSFKWFDRQGNTQNYNKDMRAYITSRTLALFWQKIEDRLIQLSNASMAAKSKYAHKDRARK